MKAILIGATGAVGSDLVRILLADERYTEVAAFVRRDLTVTHPKLRVHTINFDAPETWAQFVTGDVLFSALGTSLKQAGSKERQHHIDYDYTLSFARAAKENGVQHFVLVTSIGADATSSIFYLRLKGEIEEASRALGFAGLTVVRPPNLIRPHAKRFSETVSVNILHALNAIGIARHLAPIRTDIVARCMANIGAVPYAGDRIIDAQEIRVFADEA